LHRLAKRLQRSSLGQELGRGRVISTFAIVPAQATALSACTTASLWWGETFCNSVS
jgi:hypothetical protein